MLIKWFSASYRQLLCWVILLSCNIHTTRAAPTFDDYPNRPIRVIVPGPASGGGDTLARIISNELSLRLGRQLIVDNRPGASGMIGAELAAKAPPDGYTLFMGHSGTHAINVSMHSHMRYDPVKDFSPIALIAVTPNILVGYPLLPTKNIVELIKLAQKNDGQIKFSSGGVGFSQHLAGVLFGLMAKINIMHVSYKGGTPALMDIMSGQIELMFPNIPAAIPFIENKKLFAYGVTSINRSQALPDVPTIAEAGLKNYEAVGWFGLMAPSKTNEFITRKINQEVRLILKKPDVLKLLKSLGADPGNTTPDQFTSFMSTETKKWATIIKVAGISEQKE